MDPRPAIFWLSAIACGITCATLLTAALVWLDVGGLGHLVETVSGGTIALWVLWLALVSLFVPACAAMALWQGRE
ncbi:hypothetical protein [Jannaschia rubra]|uniref:Uncharacterized protein n=1 Tax=Jannaschia rubra TaxID=282197 RepID=A0A0M6XSN9_9RHOB|nr:hypothetical protein [Jannaschia rubra]CTQ34166.1 hypothetical protein JAN5088_02959 [Jannaschia rubra]SFG21644.1 hypothetical protein SAMN04488517_103178 [Jannaschia rubra]